MTTKQMEYILELSKTKNFNRAAENLYISQPALTYQIQRAEEELGFPLFVRSGKGANMTAAGEQFANAIGQIVDDYNEAVESGRRISPQYEAAVTIGLPERLAVSRLVETIELFAEEYPQTPVLPMYYPSDRPQQMQELPDADMLFVLRGKHFRVSRGWKEYCTTEGYLGADTLPRTQDIVVGEEDGLVWLPYAAQPQTVSLLLKSDEEREIVHIFASKFGQNVQKK